MVVGDKIKLVKPFGKFDNVGEVCEVTSIFKVGEIYFEYGGGHTGVMSYDDFEKYFELVPAENKVEQKKHEWTEWELADDDFYNPITDGFERIGLGWRTDNRKRVQVKTEDGTRLRSRSSCYKDDKFSVDAGYFLAKCRLYTKWAQKVIEDYAKSL